MDASPDLKKTINEFSKHLYRYGKCLLLVCLASVSTLIAYWGSNLGQIRPAVVAQPLLTILLFVTVLFSAFLLILRSYHQSTLLMLLIVALFFSYGHLINLAYSHHLIGSIFNPLNLLIFYSAVFLFGTFLIFRIRYIPEEVFGYFRIVAGLIVFYNLIIVLSFDPRLAFEAKRPETEVISAIESDNQPDIYLIILDAYAREDILSEIYDFDNSTFLRSLRFRGFYIPECAYSNYDFTLNTAASVLNMEYLDTLGIPNPLLRKITARQVNLVLNNQIRKLFSPFGYQFVSTRGYASFNDILDADVYLNYYGTQGRKDELGELFFIKLFFDTTLIRARTEFIFSSNTTGTNGGNLSNSVKVDTNSLAYEESDFWYHQTNYVFDTLENLPEKQGKYLVYAHINSPHGPYVFNQDGSFRFTPGSPNEDLLYTDTLVYLNSRVLNLIDNIINKSKIQPIIIIQADHGTHYFPSGINKHKILSAYYLPGMLVQKPYATITPVNDFRLILKNYFDPNFELLPDTLYIKSNGDYKSIPAKCDLVVP